MAKHPQKTSHNTGPKNKSRRQVGFLLSRGSPLSSSQRTRLKRELISGQVKVKR